MGRRLYWGPCILKYKEFDGNDDDDNETRKISITATVTNQMESETSKIQQNYIMIRRLGRRLFVLEYGTVPMSRRSCASLDRIGTAGVQFFFLDRVRRSSTPKSKTENSLLIAEVKAVKQLTREFHSNEKWKRPALVRM